MTTNDLNATQKRLIKILLAGSILLIIGLTTLIISFVIKNKHQSTHNTASTNPVTSKQLSQQLSHSNQLNLAKCQPLDFEYHDNYVVINSQICHKTFILGINHNSQYIIKH